MRLIDADKLDTRERGNNAQRTMWWNIKRIIEKAPTIDAVEVVRCIDCKHRTKSGICDHPRFCMEGSILPVAYPQDFCSYGER